jgi:RNA polymerase sigma-70 factor (ECF subfamily)
MNREARFERLVAETSRGLLAYALRRTRSPEDAADVVAETLLIAWRKVDKLPAGDGARLWLFGVARNVLRRGATRRRLESAAVERLAGELREALTPVENEGSPVLRHALAGLPESQREVILLAAWEELTPREIAVVTRAPVNLVRVRLHRARARLKAALAAQALVENADARDRAVAELEVELPGRAGRLPGPRVDGSALATRLE